MFIVISSKKFKLLFPILKEEFNLDIDPVSLDTIESLVIEDKYVFASSLDADFEGVYVLRSKPLPITIDSLYVNAITDKGKCLKTDNMDLIINDHYIHIKINRETDILTYRNSQGRYYIF